MKTRSLRARLTLWYSAILSLGLILLSCSVWIALDHILYKELFDTLANQARGLDEYIRIEDAENSPDLAQEIDEFAHALPPRHVLVITGSDGRIVYRSGQQTGASRLPEAGWKRLQLDGRPYLAMERDVALKNGQLRIVLALSSEGVDHPIQLLGVLLLVLVPAFIASGALGGRWVSRRALQPVDAITEKARAIGVSNLSERLPVPQTDDEIQRLAETWNDMLRRLEGAVSRISQFTADASHELRTPIAVIRLAAENALRKMRPEADYRGALERIRLQTESMTRLVEDLLFLARSDGSAQTAFEMAGVDLAEIAANAAYDLEPVAMAKSITLRTELQDGEAAVRGDARSLRQLVFILLDNAIKYSPDGGSVSLLITNSGGATTLTVSDSGIGISEEDQSQLFQRFHRADPSRNRESGGHGLGLAIAKAIAAAHGARIEVRSQPGEGSTFRVLFPGGAPIGWALSKQYGEGVRELEKT